MSNGKETSPLVYDVSQKSRISEDQARLAINEIMSFLGAKLPSPVMGRIREVLADKTAGNSQRNPGPEYVEREVTEGGERT